MNRVCVIFGCLLWAVLGYAQNPATNPAQAAPSALGHGSFPVKVVKNLESAKLKEGDSVEMETTGSFKLPDGTLVPKGSKLIGRVTSSKARSKGDAQSQLTIAFDSLNIAKGKQLGAKGTVQAVFPQPDEPDPGVPGASTAHGAGGSPVQAAAPPPPDYRPMSDIHQGANNETKAIADAAADPRSTGVHGIKDLTLEDGVLRSDGKQVKVNSGVRMIVRMDLSN